MKTSLKTTSNHSLLAKSLSSIALPILLAITMSPAAQAEDHSLKALGKKAADTAERAVDEGKKTADSALDSAAKATKDTKAKGDAKAATTKLPKPRTTKSGLKIEDVVVGTGKEAKSGDKVVVDYTGKLPDGKQFDTSVGRGPFEFNLGAGQVIKGWDEGVAGMRVGGKRKLTIPANLGYGERDMGVIPANSPLLFDVEMKEIK